MTAWIFNAQIHSDCKPKIFSIYQSKQAGINLITHIVLTGQKKNRIGKPTLSNDSNSIYGHCECWENKKGWNSSYLQNIFIVSFTNINKHPKQTDSRLHAYVNMSSVGLSTSKLGFISLFWMMYPYKNPILKLFFFIVNKDLLSMTDTHFINLTYKIIPVLNNLLHLYIDCINS